MICLRRFLVSVCVSVPAVYMSFLPNLAALSTGPAADRKRTQDDAFSDGEMPASKRERVVPPPPPSLDTLSADALLEIFAWATDSDADCKKINEICSVNKAFAEWCRHGRGEDFWHWVCSILDWDRDDRWWTVWTWDANAARWSTEDPTP